MLALAIPLGTLSALRPRSLLDRAVFGFTVFGVVLHPFVVGLVLRTCFPTSGHRSGRRLLPAARRSTGLHGPRQPKLRGRRRLGFAHVAALADLRGLLPAALHAHGPRACARQPRPALRGDSAGEGGDGAPHRDAARRAAALGPVAAMLAVDVAIVVTAAIYVEVVFGHPRDRRPRRDQPRRGPGIRPARARRRRRAHGAHDHRRQPALGPDRARARSADPARGPERAVDRGATAARAGSPTARSGCAPATAPRP